MLGAPRASAEPSAEGATPPHQRTHHHRHHHHHRRRARKSKTHQQSASVQFPPEDHDSTSEPSWVTSENVNIESLLPSHTIHVTKRTESPNNHPSDETPQSEKDTNASQLTDKTCDVSPLENLLAVAELELKQHIQSEKWQEASQKQLEETNIELDSNEPSDNNNPSIEEIDELIKTKAHEMQIDITDDDRKSPECSYNDDDEMSMNDILSRLEQSLQSPHGFGSDNTFEDEIMDQDTNDKVFDSNGNDKPISNDFDGTSKTHPSYETTATDNYIENPIMDYSPNDCYIQESLGDENKVVANVKAKNGDEVISLHNDESDSIQDLVSEEHKSDKNESEEIHESKESQVTNDGQKEEINTECDNTDDKNENNSHFSELVVNSSSENQTCPEIPDILEINEEKELLSPPAKEHHDTKSPATTDLENKIVEAESSTVQEDQTKLPEDKIEVGPDVLDLSVKKTDDLEVKIDTAPEPVTVECDEGPTDLSIRKPVLTFNFELPSPASQSSEVSQSPQPSGIPAVPPSPDLVTTSTTTSKPRSVFLESLLATSMNKNARKANNIITKQKEPLDLGKSRKSASPTVTCSEEIVHSSEFEPPAKRLKPDEITLKNLLEKDSDPVENCPVKSTSELPMVPESTRPSNQKSHQSQTPLSEFRQLLEEIDIPNPLMVPKDIFPDLLKHPKQEILKILSGQSKKNVSLDDILVVYKDKLLAAIEASQSHSASVSSNESLKAPIEKPSGSGISDKPVQVTTKRKSTDNSTSKGPNISPDSKSSLANDIDAANEAALFWAGCPNPFEAMANYANHTDLIQALYNASTFPYFPSQLGELHPGLQMMLGAKIAPPLSFPPPPPVNMNNPFEMSMWQEAMMQASLLQNNNPYENSILNQPNYKSNIESKSKNHMQQSYANRLGSRHGSNGHGKNMHQNQQQQFLAASSYGQNMAGNDPSWQNPYLGLAGFQQGSNNLTLNIPQFNPFGFKNNPTSPTSKHSQLTSPSHLHKQSREAKMKCESEKKLHSQEQHKLQQMQQQKMLRQQHHQYQLQQQMQQHQQNMRQAAASQKQQGQSGLAKKNNCIPSFSSLKECIQQEKSLMEAHKPGGIRQGPMDLSGPQKKGAGCSGRSTVTSSKGGGDDVPEVGSTTGSIEDMQDQHTQLWHPLFGSHNKGYNPWSLPSLTAMGE